MMYSKFIWLLLMALIFCENPILAKEEEEELPAEKDNVCTATTDSEDECQAPKLLTGPTYVGELKLLEFDCQKIVDPFAFRLGLPPNVTNELRQYAREMGFIKLVWDLMSHEEYSIGQSEVERIMGKNWYIQRPKGNKKSNAHFVYPNDEKAHDHLLRVLGDGRFDEALEAIGKQFHLEHLTIYSVGFFVLNHVEEGWIHDELSNDNKTFNVLVPLNLYLKNETMSQVRVASRNDANVTVSFPLLYDVAIGFGNGTQQSAGACDFRSTGGVRLMASIYMAEINEDNVESIVEHLQSPFPPANKEYLLQQQGSHWNKDGTAHLPRDYHSWTLTDLSIKPGPTEIGKLAPLEFTDGTVVDPYAFRIKFPETLTQTLREYCDKMGLPEMFEKLMTPEGAYEPGDGEYVKIKGHQWYIQRPAKKWHSTSHWLNPMDEEAQDHFLRMLGDGGFDLVLEAIGNHFGLDGLVCYSVGFFVVDHCEDGYMHHDFKHVKGKAFNLLLPVQLVKESVSVLKVESVDYSNLTVSVGYEEHVAVGVGDETRHATGDCDYRETGGKRVMVTIYLADIDEGNVDNIIEHYTDPYPPAEEDYLLSRSGTHWSSDGLTHLPHGDARTETEQQLLPGPSEVGQVSPLQFVDGVSVDPYSFRVGVPESLTKALRDYCDDMHLTKVFHELMGSGRIEPNGEEYITLKGFNWYMQAPAKKYNTTSHWLNPTDEAAHEQFLRVLGDGGFDQVLDGLGRHIGFEGLACYSVGFVALDQSNETLVYYDFKRVSGKAFNILLPIILPTKSKNETSVGQHFVRTRNDPNLVAKVDYEYNTAIGLGDYTRHATGNMDYRDSGEMIVLATIYVADIDEANVKNLIRDFSDPFPPKDADYFLKQRGIHWNKDGSARLPRGYEPPPESDDGKTDYRAPREQKKETPKESPKSMEAKTESLKQLGPTEPGQVSLLEFSNGQIVDPYAFRIGLPRTLTMVLRSYCNTLGLTKLFGDLMGDDGLDPDDEDDYELNGVNYYVQRPSEMFHSTAHWLNPMDDHGFQQYLRVLSEGGFDVVLDSIGRHFGLDGLACYSVGFVVVDECEDGYVYWDFKHVDGKAFSLYIPLMFDPNIVSEHYIQSRNNEEVWAHVPYEDNVAIGVGDNTKHAEGDFDYSDSDNVIVMATVYLADINEDNVESLLFEFTDPFPPQDADYFLKQAGIHWNKDGTAQLPRNE